MKPALAILCMISVAMLNADNTPVSAQSAAGKTVYIPIAKPIDVKNEAHIQQSDHNVTQTGGKL